MRINCILAHMKYIPNLLTLLNAASGCIALYFVGSLELETAMYFVLLGAFFDLFDGLLARSFGVDGPLGTQLDSLADLITFGVVPGAVAVVSLSYTSLDLYLSLLGFAITIGSVYRLAKFNTLTEKAAYFKGLPTPANALFWLGLPLLPIDFTSWQLLLLVLLSTYLLNSQLIFLRLKIRKGLGANAGLLLATVGTLILFVIFGWGALTPILVAYVVVSALFTIYKKLKS